MHPTHRPDSDPVVRARHRWSSAYRLVGALAILGLLAGCGGTSDPAEGSEAAGEGAENHLTVATMYLCNEVAFAWAEEKGIFEEHDVDVDYVRIVGGSAGIAALVSGDAQVAFGNSQTQLVALQEGFPLRSVGGLYESAPGSNNTGVAANSEIQGPADLEGKVIGVNELQGINQVMTAAWLRDNGVDPSTVKWTALPFPELGPAVAEDRIDAAALTSSQMVPLELDGTGRDIGNPFMEVMGPIVFVNYVVLNDFYNENQELLERFHEAIAEATDQVNDPANEDEKFAVMAEFCSVEEQALRQTPEATYEAKVDVDVLAQMADLFVAEGVLAEAPDVEAFVAPFAVK